MTNLPHTLSNEMLAILFFGGHLEKWPNLKWPGIVFKCLRCNEDMVKISCLYHQVKYFLSIQLHYMYICRGANKQILRRWSVVVDLLFILTPLVFGGFELGSCYVVQ